jgi:hypothetical protein
MHPHQAEVERADAIPGGSKKPQERQTGDRQCGGGKGSNKSIAPPQDEAASQTHKQTETGVGKDVEHDDRKIPAAVK